MPTNETATQVKSWSDVDFQISKIREKEQIILSFQRDYDDEVLKLQKKYIDPKQNFQDEANFLKGKIKDFCDTHRKEMDDQKKKVLSNGEIYYRALPLKLKPLEKETEGSIIKKIVKLGKKYIDKYLRIKTDLDMNTLKKEYNEGKIDDKFIKSIGLISESGESFSIKPNP